MQRLVILVLVAVISAVCAAESLKFQKKLLMIDANEGCAIADVNRDGRPDVIAGRNWYAAPDFAPRALPAIEDWRSYAETNGDHVFDVDGDGWVDVISGSWCMKEVYWFRNPGRIELSRGRLWKKRLLIDVGTKTNEAYLLHDLDNDGAPEWIVNNWNKKAPLVAWKLTKDAKGQPSTQKIVIGSSGNGHGIGLGDIDGDGGEDILVGVGWYERPAENALSAEWVLHRDWDLHASCPMIVTDLDGDERNDVIWGDAHKYGLYWMPQLPPDGDGKRRWKQHLIDKSWSQPHCLAWADLDGDGQPELITGKRVRAHGGSDPGGKEPPCLYYYTWDRTAMKFTRHTIDEGTIGIGMQICTGDLNADGRLDIVVAGKAGTYILFNQGKR